MKCRKCDACGEVIQGFYNKPNKIKLWIVCDVAETLYRPDMTEIGVDNYEEERLEKFDLCEKCAKKAQEAIGLKNYTKKIIRDRVEK